MPETPSGAVGPFISSHCPLPRDRIQSDSTVTTLMMIEEIFPREQVKEFCPIREIMSVHIIKDSCCVHRFELHCKRFQIKYLRELEHGLTDHNLDVNFGPAHGHVEGKGQRNEPRERRVA